MIGNIQPIAPVSIIVPNSPNQVVSGALFISGADLYCVTHEVAVVLT